MFPLGKKEDDDRHWILSLKNKCTSSEENKRKDEVRIKAAID